jgi:excinuclease UvrABC ATPase subunit
VKGGRCEACQGDGVLRVEMHFLPDVFVTCDTCAASRYNRETLEVRTAACRSPTRSTSRSSRPRTSSTPSRIARQARSAPQGGLGLRDAGAAGDDLSGGEAQRVKLARELARKATGRTLYVLDEPTTGLHFADIEVLLAALLDLRDQGNTIVVIEHNLDVVACADWVIDLGPEGGEGGGEIVAAGTPEQVASVRRPRCELRSEPREVRGPRPRSRLSEALRAKIENSQEDGKTRILRRDGSLQHAPMTTSEPPPNLPAFPTSCSTLFSVRSRLQVASPKMCGD